MAVADSEGSENSPLVSTSQAGELTGCGGSLACNPHRGCHKYFVLIFICFLSFGGYFCYDNPAALQSQIKKVMNVDTEDFMNLYAFYSWPNVILCFFGGFLIDTVFGIRLGTIIFSFFVMSGQILFAIGALNNKYWLMEAGRFVFGIGGESLAVAQNTYAVSWFKGKELNMVFGLQLSFSRVGSTVNMNIMGPLYTFISKEAPNLKPYSVLGWTLLVGGLMCLLSLFCAFAMAFFDKRSERILNKSEGKTGEVIRFKDVKDFPLPLWLIFLICVAYYVAVFPFIGLGLVFFEEKFGSTPHTANAINSVVFILSAAISPLLGFIVDRTGRNLNWVILAIIGTLGAHMILAFTWINPFVPMVLMGISYSLLACALWPLVSLVVPEHQLGTAYGFMQSIQNLGLAVISIAAGKIVDTKGYLVLEVFFAAWLSVALMAGLMLLIVNAAKGGKLNLSRSQWAKLSTAKFVSFNDSEEASKGGTRYEDTGVSIIRPRSAENLRHRLLSRIGQQYFQMPENLRISSLSYPHVLK